MTTTASIAQILTSTLNPDSSIRISAELSLSELLKSPQSALSLAQLILSQDAESSLRQSATIVLRKYVKEHWSPFFQQFRGDAPPPEVKDQIRQAVFQGLSDSDRKIRSLCAHTLSTIANSDWPDEYPDLLNHLVQLLLSGSPSSTHGAMQVFTEFVRTDLTEDQLLPVMRELLPVLMSVLSATEQHTPLTRSRTISVFRQCVEALYMVKDQHPQAAKEAAANVLPTWLDAFNVLLNLDPQQDVSGEHWDGLEIRVQIFKTLDTLHTSFPRVIAPYLPGYVTASLRHLHALYPTYVQYYLADSTAVPNSSEGEPIELYKLAAPLVDFVTGATRQSKARVSFDDGTLAQLVDALVQWGQMTKENEEEWAADANAFISQEEDDTQVYSIRAAVFDLFSSLLTNAPVQTASMLHSSVQRTVTETNQAREAGVEDWWRPLESAFAILGSQAETILDISNDEHDAGRPRPIDIEYLLTHVIPSLLTLSAYPFLQGRCLFLASRFADLLPPDVRGQYLDAAVQVIESNETEVPFKLSAVKSIQHFARYISDAQSAIIPRITRDLGPFLLETSEDTLSLVLETISVLCEVGDGSWFTTDLAGALTTALLDVWPKNIKDPIFLSILNDVLHFIASAKVPGVYETAVKQALPRLTASIGTANANESWVASSALELIGSVARGAPETGLGEGFFAAIAPCVFDCLRIAEDRDVLQNGVLLLTLVVRKDVGQLLAWTHTDGQSGLLHVFTVIARLLQNQDESGGLVIGDLIIHLFRRAGDSVLPVLPDLLQAMLVRMRTAQTATFLQSLVVPFAFLVYSHRDAALDLLEATRLGEGEGEDGRLGLEVLLNTWCENASTFQGFWPTRVSALALCTLLASERPSLQAVVVKGDIIITATTKNTIMTRSKTKVEPPQFTRVAFPVKALKLLLHELQPSGEASLAAPQAPIDAQFDDGDSDWSDEERVKEERFSFLADMMGVGGPSFDDDDDLIASNDDEDLQKDPISLIDLRAHVTTFIRESAARDADGFGALTGQLSAEEMIIMQRALQQEQS